MEKSVIYQAKSKLLISLRVFLNRRNSGWKSRVSQVNTRQWGSSIFRWLDPGQKLSRSGRDIYKAGFKNRAEVNRNKNTVEREREKHIGEIDIYLYIKEGRELSLVPPQPPVTVLWSSVVYSSRSSSRGGKFYTIR